MKRVLFIIAGLATLLLGSCVKEKFDDGSGKNPRTGFTLNYKVLNGVSTTYATVEAKNGEDQVNDLHIFFFDESSGGTGLYREYYDATPGDGTPLNSYGSIKVELPPSSSIDFSRAHNILIVANLKSYLGNTDVDEWAETFIGMSEEEVVGTMYAYVEGAVGSSESDDTKMISSNNITMSARIKKEAVDEQLDVELIRIVSRFDILNKASGYRLVSASVWNAFPRTHIWQSQFNEYGLERIQRYYGIKEHHSIIEYSANPLGMLEGGLYAFENYVVRPEQNDRVTTCVIVGLDDGAETSYYRINVNAKSMGQTLKRNNVYRININNVLGKGAGSEIDAYTDSELWLDVNINGWTVDDQGNIQYDGENILAIPTSNIRFEPSGGEQEFNIFTLGEGYLDIYREDLPAGITASLVGNLLTVNAASSEESRYGMIELRFGNLRASINISQTGEKAQYLDLSTSTLPAFGFESGSGMSGEVKVLSSGPWTATIYNGNFSFDQHSSVEEINGVDGGTFKVWTSSLNSAPKARYSFALVSLDSDVENHSRVLILTQNGTGGIRVTPLPLSVSFTPEGVAMNNNVFDVETDAGAQWEPVLSGSSNFSVVSTASGFTITANPNPESAPLSATLRIRLKAIQTVYEEVTITQGAHNLEINPGTVPAVSMFGGLSDEIEITSSESWTASIATANTTAFFEGTNSTAMTGTDGQSFRIRFPLNYTPPRGVTPTATVTVRLDGTNITKTIVVSQSRIVVPANIYLQNSSSGYGSIYDGSSGGYVSQFRASLISTANFSSSGTCYAGTYSLSRSTSIASNTQIYGINNGSVGAGSTAIWNWMNASDKRVFLLWGDLACAGIVNSLGLNSQGYTGQTDSNIGQNVVRTINPDSRYTVDTHPLFDYLLRRGPFTAGTEIPKSYVRLYPNDNTHGSLISWPDGEMIPLIVHNGKLILGVDVKRRIIFCGDTEIFHSETTNTRENYSGGAYSEYNLKFLNNLLAWMSYVAMYGDEFLELFQDFYE